MCRCKAFPSLKCFGQMTTNSPRFLRYEVVTRKDRRLLAHEHAVQCIFHLKNLRTLRLSGNKISSLPSQIEELTQLQELALDGNQLQSLPAELASLTQLKKLLVQYVRQRMRVPAAIYGCALLQVQQNKRTSRNFGQFEQPGVLGSEQQRAHESSRQPG